jgi:hypothetical protein
LATLNPASRRVRSRPGDFAEDRSQPMCHQPRPNLGWTLIDEEV